MMNEWIIKIPKYYKIKNLIVILFSILPIVDSINGYLSGNKPIGSIYKIFILLVLIFTLIASKKKVSEKSILVLLFSTAYIIFSIFINTVVFNGKILFIDFPIKLIFNIFLFFLLYECIKKGILTGNTMYRILNNSSWLFIVCFLVPRFLGLGNTIYADDIGYKAFFISQNELSVVLIIYCFFSSYKLFLKINFINAIQLGLLISCGMIVNTKSTIIACLASVVILLIIKMKQGKLKSKLAIGILIFIGIILLKNTILDATQSMVYRYDALKRIHYGNSVLSSLLSGRNFYLKSAFDYLGSTHGLFRFAFGNGFCSNILIEMDFFDIFFYLGLIGLIGMLAFVVWIYKKIRESSKIDKSKIRVIYFVIIISVVFFAGHVMFMAMSGSYFAIYICFLIFYKSDKIDILKSIYNIEGTNL